MEKINTYVSGIPSVCKPNKTKRDWNYMVLGIVHPASTTSSEIEWIEQSSTASNLPKSFDTLTFQHFSWPVMVRRPLQMFLHSHQFLSVAITDAILAIAHVRSSKRYWCDRWALLHDSSISLRYCCVVCQCSHGKTEKTAGRREKKQKWERERERKRPKWEFFRINKSKIHVWMRRTQNPSG